MKDMNYIEKLNFRYATKKFDDSKHLSEQQIEEIKSIIQLSASSYGLQPYKVFIIKDEDLRAKLKDASYNQPQITDASHLVVFTAMKTIDETYLDEYINNISETRNVEKESLEEFKNTISNTTLQLDDKAQQTWSEKQCYIALGNLLSGVASMGLDACPMEGFENDRYNEILDLESKNLHATVIATLGVRSDEDELQHAKKVRKPKEKLFTEI